MNWHPSSKQLVSGSIENTIRLWDVATGQCLQALSYHREGVQSVAFNDQGGLITGGRDNALALWLPQGRGLATRWHLSWSTHRYFTATDAVFQGARGLTTATLRLLQQAGAQGIQQALLEPSPSSPAAQQPSTQPPAAATTTHFFTPPTPPQSSSTASPPVSGRGAGRGSSTPPHS